MAKSLITPQSGSGQDFVPVPQGTYAAKCVGMYDIGTQVINSATYGTSHKRQIVLTFELVSEVGGAPAPQREDGKNFTISRTFTWSMHENGNLLPFLNSWRGKPFTPEEANQFDISKLGGQPALIQVIHQQVGERTYANISSIMTWKGEVKAENEVIIFSAVDEEDVPNVVKLPQWVQDKVRQAPEWKGEQTPAEAAQGIFGQQTQLADENINVEDVPF